MAVAETSVIHYPSCKVQTWFRALSLAAVSSTFALVVLGGVVRVTGSGLGCPDWPLCHGSVLPPLEAEAIIEYTHRVVASALVGPLVLATCVLAWIAFRWEPWLTIPAALGMILLVGQAILGGVTVVNELPGDIVIAHLALGEALLGCLVFISVIAYRGPPPHPTAGWAGSFPWLTLASAGAVYVVLLSGSYVTNAGATGACFDWPLCQGDLIPEHRLQMIHVAHRFVAAIAGLFLAFVLYRGIRQGHRPESIRLLSKGIAALFLAQVLIGAVTVWLKFPADFRALHLGLATAVWGTAVVLAAASFTEQHFPAREPADV
jgi:heme A synthase